MTEPISLTVTKLIRANRHEVFSAWVTPHIMEQWFVPEGLTLTESSADPRVGGHLHAVMKGDGETHSVRGTYREIVPGTRLVFTHRWDEPDATETLVRVDFAERDGRTLVTLTHENFRDEETRDGHVQGWSSTLDSLEHYFDEKGAQ